MSLYYVNANYEDVFQLDFPRINSNQIINKIEKHPEWKQYNKSKTPNNPREGLSITSHDGGMSGVPDLGSLHQHWLETGVFYSEERFNVRTPICDDLPEFKEHLDYFQEHVGRTHFLRLPAGSYFPPHRDNGFELEPRSFRLVVPLNDITPSGSHVWMLDGKPLTLLSGQTYYVNTVKSHSLFSMYDSLYLCVFNITATEESCKKLVFRSKTK